MLFLKSHQKQNNVTEKKKKRHQGYFALLQALQMNWSSRLGTSRPPNPAVEKKLCVWPYLVVSVFKT